MQPSPSVGMHDLFCGRHGYEGILLRLDCDKCAVPTCSAFNPYDAVEYQNRDTAPLPLNYIPNLFEG